MLKEVVYEKTTQLEKLEKLQKMKNLVHGVKKVENEQEAVCEQKY